MNTASSQRYLLLDARQRGGGLDGWMSTPALAKNVIATAAGLALAPLIAGGGAAGAGALPGRTSVVACDGERIEIEGDRVYVTRPAAARDLRAIVWPVCGGKKGGAWIAYVPLAARLERWRTKEPTSAEDVELLWGGVWDEAGARSLAERCAGGAACLGPAEEMDYPGDWLVVDACRSRRRGLPGFGGTGSAPGRLRGPRGLALAGSLLYVADTGNHRVQVLDLARMTLRYVWGGPGAGAATGEFDSPESVAVTCGGDVFVADTGNDRVQKRVRRTGEFRVIDGSVLAARVYFVTYGERRGDRFVHVPALGRLECWLAGSAEVRVEPGMYGSADAARARVLSVLDAAGAVDLLMEWDEAYPAARVAPADVPPPMKSPTRVAVCGGIVYVWCAGANEVYLLDEAGRLVGREADVAGVFPAEDASPGAGGGVAKAGSLLTTRLDSGVDRCVWHKVLMRLARPLPSGARVTVWTYSTNDAGVTTADVALLGPDEWRTGQSNAAEFLVRSPPGRFLWLRLELTGSGVASPLVEQLRVYFPRDGYLQYLPAVYQADPTSRDFLDRFLSIFEAEFSRIEETVSGLSRLFNARGTPEPFLAWLGAWVGMVFQPSWPAVNRRELLRRSAELYRRRGTAGGLALFVELALGLNVRIVEGWRARRVLILGRPAPLGSGSILLGDCAGDRLRLDVHSRVGEFRLNDVGDPRHDAVAAGAHEFTVYVDGPLSDLVERSLRQLIDQEKPAHASYALRQVSGRLRVGVEATVGVDTGVGPPPRATLGREASLGRDTVLACDPVAAAAPVIGSVEVG